MNILILTGRFGMGHYAVASTLVEEITKDFPASSIIVKDIFEYAMPEYCEKLYGAYSVLVNHGSKLYNLFYKYTENSKTGNKLIFSSFFITELHYLIVSTQPDIIISTLPFCSKLVAAYKKRYHSTIPTITCITDISTHSDWITRNTDAYFVASETTKQELIKRGIDPQIIFITGIPVKEQFKQLSRNQEQQDKHLLIMGGGLGILPKEMSFYEQLDALPQVKTTVLAGKNTAILKKLYGKYKNIEVVGYTDQVSQYMKNADLVISKPGGITLFETIYAELPILVICPFLQQETENARFIENLHIGKVLWHRPQNVIAEIDDLIHDEMELFLIRSNMQLVKNSLNSNILCQVLLQLKNKGICA